MIAFQFSQMIIDRKEIWVSARSSPTGLSVKNVSPVDGRMQEKFVNKCIKQLGACQNEK